MSRRRAIKRHLEAVKPGTMPEKPTPVGFPVTIEIPTAGRGDVDGLIRELARAAFHGQLRGYKLEADGPRVRSFITVQPMSNFGPDEVQAGVKGILSALVAVGVLRLKPKAADAPVVAPQDSTPPDPKAIEDGPECPPSSQAD